jgi:hypothetical protein
MKNNLIIILIGGFLFLHAKAIFAQKKISEFTVVYNYTMSMAGKENGAPGATHTLFINGNLSRSEFNSPMISFSAIRDANTGSGAILRELSGQKLLIPMTADDWRDRNKRYDGLRYAITNETKTIAGYRCVKATAMTNDSLRITVYYTRDLIPDAKEFDPQFRGLDGLPLEYEIQKGNLTIRYVLNSINMNPVPASKFDIPKSGYRVLTYEESKKLYPGSGTN